jgi:hypothetical protein
VALQTPYGGPVGGIIGMADAMLLPNIEKKKYSFDDYDPPGETFQADLRCFSRTDRKYKYLGDKVASQIEGSLYKMIY